MISAIQVKNTAVVLASTQNSGEIYRQIIHHMSNTRIWCDIMIYSPLKVWLRRDYQKIYRSESCAPKTVLRTTHW